MALRMLCAARNLANSFRTLTISNGNAINLVQNTFYKNDLLKSSTPIVDSIRAIGFLNRSTGEALYKSVTSVSNAGRKRGRARSLGKGMPKQLNRGQVIGEGRVRLNLPGLNQNVRDDTKVVQPSRGTDDPEWQAKLNKLRDQQRNRRKKIKDSSERGYVGHTWPGKSLGPPDSIHGYDFTDFDTRNVEFKIVNTMRGNIGRFRRHSAFSITGNGNGIVGFALGKSCDPKAALRKSKNRAGQNLVEIPICDGHTVYHDFFCQFGCTKIFVTKKPQGYGLCTHRIIKTICQLAGIKDLHAKIEGSTSPQFVVKAFVMGLLQQKTFQQLAEEKKLYLVEFRNDTNNFPHIVGVPSKCRTIEEIPKDEQLDFNLHVMNNKVAKRPRKYPPFYERFPSYQIHLKRYEKIRAIEAIKFDALTRYGSLRSFLTDKYPEAQYGPRIKKDEPE